MNRTPRPTALRAAAASMAATVAVIALLATATVRPAAASDAPLDTLVTEAAPPAAADVGISRRTLPDVSATIPRRAPPTVPPRLDDPAGGWRLFLSARNATDAGAEAVAADLRLAREARLATADPDLADARSPAQPGSRRVRLASAGRRAVVPGDPWPAPRLLIRLTRPRCCSWPCSGRSWCWPA
ncbi:MAG: hypothetical protein R3D98_14170 [Candidatus Krumholzibacteriia bacterium]